MALEPIEDIKYFSLRYSRITSTSGDHKGAQYKSISGRLISIDHIEDEYEGEVIHKWHFKLHDEPRDEKYIVQVSEKASAARGIIASLLMIPDPTITYVKFTPYPRKSDSGKTFTNVWVQWSDDQGKNWQDVEWDENIINHMPSAEEVVLADGTKIWDDGKRRMFVRKMVNRIRKDRIKDLPAPETQNVPDPGKDLYEEPEGRPSPPPAHTVPKNPMPDNWDNWSDEDDLPFF